MEDTVLEWYSAKHGSPSGREVDLVNGIDVDSCPYCGHGHPARHGHRGDGIQRYRCPGCGRTFTALTGTIFDSRKIPISEWVEYLLHLFEYHSLRSSAFDNRNASSTGKYWLLKVFEVLDGIQDGVVLGGKVFLDETFLPVVGRDTVTRNGMKLRGLSRNKICVCCAVEGREGGRSVLVASSAGKPSKPAIWNAYGSHIASGATIVHDGESSHDILLERLGLVSTVYTAKDTKGLADKDNPLEPVNELHGLLKRFIKAHGGYDRGRLQDWLNLFWFISNGPEDKYDKVVDFMGLALESQHRVRYREAMGRKNG